MKVTKSIVGLMVALSIGMAGFVQPAFAGEKAKYLVEVIEVNPATGSQWNDGWNGLNEMAEDGDYPFREVVLSSQNKRWIVTKVDNYAGVDNVMAARQNFAEKHGNKFERAIGKMEGAQLNSDSFISALDDELSYRPKGQSQGAYTKIEIHTFRTGSHEEMASIGADFKKLATKLNSPNGWEVWWNQLGSPGSSVTIVSSADSPLAMAQADAADAELYGSKQKEVDAITKRFTNIVLRSTTEYAMFQPEMSVNLETE